MEDGKSKEEWGQEEWIRLQRWQASDSALFALYLKIAFYFFEVRATSYLFFKQIKINSLFMHYLLNIFFFEELF